MKNKTEITMPDFEKWTSNLLINVGKLGGISATEMSVEVALKQAFDQGYALGQREGYIEGTDFGWVYALESDEEWIKLHDTNEEYVNIDEE